MASSDIGLNLGGLQVFADHTLKNKRKPMLPWTLRVMQNFFYTCFIFSDIRTWWTVVVLIMKNLKTPIWAPYRDKDGTGCGISGVYLWVTHNSKEVQGQSTFLLKYVIEVIIEAGETDPRTDVFMFGVTDGN